MPWYIFLVIVLPLLFVIGLVYNALKEQRRLERTVLPEIIKRREQERQELLRDRALLRSKLDQGKGQSKDQN